MAHDYTGHDIQPQDNGPQFQYKKNPAKLGQTSYNTDFIGEDPNFVRELNAYPEGPSGDGNAAGSRKVKFNGSTNYRDEFVGKDLPAQVPEGNAPNPKADFKGESTYDHDFHTFKGVDYTNFNHPDQNIEQVNANLRSLQPKRSKMQTGTNYQDAYQGHDIQPAEPVERVVQPQVGKISNKTSYNTEFTRFKNLKTGPDSYFDQFNTTGGATSGRRKNQIPFRGETSYNQTYLGQQLGEAVNDGPLPEAPKGKFDPNTIYGKSYAGKNVDLAKILNNDNIAEDGQNLANNGQTSRRTKVKFNGQTNYQSDFIEKNLGPQEAAPTRTKGPKGKFDGRTIQNTDFTEKQLGKYTHAENAVTGAENPNKRSSRRHRAQFKGVTSYREAYIGRKNQNQGDLPNLPEANKGKFSSRTTYGTFHDSKLIPQAQEINQDIQQELKITTKVTKGNKSARSSRRPHMDLRTSYGQDFIKPKNGKNAWEIRKLKNKFGKAKFNGRTTYNSEFIQRENIRYESDNGQVLVQYNSARDRVRPKFRGSTTYNAGYCGGI